MVFYLYSVVLPILIIIIILWFYRPLKMKNVFKALVVSIIPLCIYTLFIYFLEMENYLDTGWSFYSLTFFLIPYGVISIIMLLLLRNK